MAMGVLGSLKILQVGKTLRWVSLRESQKLLALETGSFTEKSNRKC